MKPLTFAPEAVDELAEAKDWYAERSPRVVSRLNTVVRHIGAHPKRYPVQKRRRGGAEFRRALVLGFPYAIFFAELESEIRVIAFGHLKRRPLYWLKRARRIETDAAQ